MAAGGCAMEGGERAQAGDCPAGEVCSSTTPNGLHFAGVLLADELVIEGPAATAIGGTQEITIQEQTALFEYEEYDAPFRADDDGGNGVRILAHEGAVVTVEGAASRSNYLRILEPNSDRLLDRYELTGAAVGSIELVTDGHESLPSVREGLVWGPGEQSVGVGLFGDVQTSLGTQRTRIVDTSMDVALDGATRKAWDVVRFNAKVGTYTAVVTAGDQAARQLSLEVVGGADRISLVDGAAAVTAERGATTMVCFQATNANRYVYGLTWRFVIGGTATVNGHDAYSRNCAAITLAADAPASVPVIASAGGTQLSLDVLVTDSAAKLAPANQPAIEHAYRPTEGERARD